MGYELLPHQQKCVDQALPILKAYKIVYLAMEVRTGKTGTGITIADRMGWKRVLIITTKKAITSIQGDHKAIGPMFPCNVINYESLHKVKELFGLEFSQFDGIIIDEADKLGQFPKPAIKTMDLREVLLNLPIIFMSGTPCPETESQLYHQFYVSSFSPWSKFHVERMGFYQWCKAGYVDVKKVKINADGERNDYTGAVRDKVYSDVGKYFVTCTQVEAGFKQLVTEEIVTIPMKSSTYHLARIILRDRVYRGKDGKYIVASTAGEVSQTLHQIFSGTVIVDDDINTIPGTNQFKKHAITIDTGKIDYIKANKGSNKIAIFYMFQQEGEALKAAFPDDWTDDQDAFNACGSSVFICQIRSGKQGVNIATADIQYMYNIDYSANSYWQVRARTQQFDREKEVRVVWLFAAAGIEWSIYQVVQQKKDYNAYFFDRDFIKGDKFLKKDLNGLEISTKVVHTENSGGVDNIMKGLGANVKTEFLGGVSGNDIELGTMALPYAQAQGNLFGEPEPVLPTTRSNDTRIAERQHDQLLRLYGSRPSQKCKSCIHLYAKQYGNVYYKCDKAKDSNSESTDWRVNWMACGLHQNG